MKLFASSTLFWGQPLETICQKVKGAHLQGVEIWVEQMHLYNWSILEIEHLINKYDLQLSIHARSWDLNLASLNEEIRQASVQEIIHTLHIAKALKVGSITVHPGRKMIAHHPRQLYEKAMHQSLEQLHVASERMGAIVSFELLEHLPKELYYEPEQLNDLLSPYTNFCSTFDIAHIALQDNIELKLDCLEKIDKIHISDATSHTFHVALGTGELDLSTSLWTRISQYDVPVVLEGLCYDGTMFSQHLNYVKELGIVQDELFSN